MINSCLVPDKQSGIQHSWNTPLVVRAKIVSSKSLASARPVGRQPSKPNTSTCLLYFSVHFWCQSAIVCFCSRTCSRWFSSDVQWRLRTTLGINSSDSLWMKAHANAFAGFRQVRFCLALGLRETAVCYTGPVHRAKTVKQILSHGIWKNGLEVTLRCRREIKSGF